MNSTETKTELDQLAAYLREQFPATIGHIPLQEKLDTLRTRLKAVEKANGELVEALIQTFGEYLKEDYSDIPDGRAVGEFSAADFRKAKKVLKEAKALLAEIEQ